MLSTIRYKIAVFKAFLLQKYYDLKSYEETPLKLIAGDYADSRVVVPVPRRDHYRK